MSEILPWLHSICENGETGMTTIIPLWQRCGRRRFRAQTNWFHITGQFI